MGLGLPTGRMLLAAGIATGVTLALDQGTKAAVRAHLPVSYRDAGAFDIGHQRNYGAALGLHDHASAVATFVTGGVVAGVMLAVAHRSHNPVLAAVGAGMVLGGGIGNGIDRARHGYVTDFIHTTDAFGYYNVADAALFTGLGLTGLAFVLR